MKKSNILFIGMDVHKASIVISLVDHNNSEVRCYGKIEVFLSDFNRILRKLVLTMLLYLCESYYKLDSDREMAQA